MILMTRNIHIFGSFLRIIMPLRRKYSARHWRRKFSIQSEIYFNAPEDVCDSLIEILMKTKDSGEAAVLMSCLAMQGGDKALAALMELERSPRPWRKKTICCPSVYARAEGGLLIKKDAEQNLILNLLSDGKRRRFCGIAG